MSDLTGNKIFGAVLATGLVILGLQTVSEAVYHSHAPAKPGYAIAIKEDGRRRPAAAEVAPDWGTVLPVADIAAGQTVSSKCAACHNFAAGGPNLVGLQPLWRRRPQAGQPSGLRLFAGHGRIRRQARRPGPTTTSTPS